MVAEGSQPQTAVKWVRQNSKHTGSMKTVLIMLADFIDDGNDCPSQKELAAAAGLSTDTIRRVLQELAKDKTIIITKAGGKKVKGGQRDCYAMNREAVPETTLPDTTGLQELPRTQQPGSHIPPSMEQPGSISEDTPVYVSDVATREKDMSGKEKEKDKKTLFPASAGKSNAPDEIDSDPDPFDGMIIAIGQIFGAIDKEALNYYNMLIGRSIKGDWIQPIFKVAMTEQELRSWWAWYHAKYPTVERVKKPEKIASSVAEYRRILTTTAPAPARKQFAMLSKADIEAARREFNFDVPEFSYTGAQRHE